MNLVVDIFEKSFFGDFCSLLICCYRKVWSATERFGVLYNLDPKTVAVHSRIHKSKILVVVLRFGSISTQIGTGPQLVSSIPNYVVCPSDQYVRSCGDYEINFAGSIQRQIYWFFCGLSSNFSNNISQYTLREISAGIFACNGISNRNNTLTFMFLSERNSFLSSSSLPSNFRISASGRRSRL